MSPPTARIDVVAGKAAGISILLDGDLLIGRQAEGVGRLGEDEEISRSHAHLSVDSSGSCAIEDLGSTNGTFVNAVRISAPQTLREGDTIEMGGTTLIVRELPSPVAEQPARTAGSKPTIVPGAPEAPVVPTPAPPEPQGAPSAPTPAPSGPPIEQGKELAPPTLSLTLELDFAVQEARVFLDGESEPQRFVLEAGRWRAASSSPAEERGA
jgi:predicted component of type VI protein secretion system